MRVVEGVVLVCLVEEPRIKRPYVGGHSIDSRVLAYGDCVS